MSFGGNEDGTGTIPMEVLKTTVNQFGLALNVDELARKELGSDSTEALNYQEFAQMFQEIFSTKETGEARPGLVPDDPIANKRR